MNYSFMYRYYVGEIYKEVYSKWDYYTQNPNKILKLLTDYGYPEEQSKYVVQEILSTPISIDIPISKLEVVDLKPVIQKQ